MPLHLMTAREKTGIFQAKIYIRRLFPPHGGGEAGGPVDIVIWTKKYFGPHPLPRPHNFFINACLETDEIIERGYLIPMI